MHTQFDRHICDALLYRNICYVHQLFILSFLEALLLLQNWGWAVSKEDEEKA